MIENIKQLATRPVGFLLGQTLAGIHAYRWQSEWCDNALFAFQLQDHKSYILQYSPTRLFECVCIELNQHFQPTTQIHYDDPNESKILGQKIVDFLAPPDRELWSIDSLILQFSSGFGLSQETGAPIGTLPSLYLHDRGSDSELISLQDTSPWVN